MILSSTAKLQDIQELLSIGSGVLSATEAIDLNEQVLSGIWDPFVPSLPLSVSVEIDFHLNKPKVSPALRI